jgi:hypothetical protein
VIVQNVHKSCQNHFQILSDFPDFLSNKAPKTNYVGLSIKLAGLLTKPVD